MRNHGWLILWPLLCWCAGGCAAPGQGRAFSWMEQLHAGAMLDPNQVVVETALIERPVGDRYINEELWGHTDEMVVELEQKAALDENGLRVGQLVGTPPAGFQTLLLSKRSCSNPSRLMVPAGKLIPQYLGPVLPHSSFDVMLGEGKTELEIDQARFCLDVVPTLTRDGRTKLAITPRVETGEHLLPFQPSPEDASWVLRIERPSKRYPELSWEVTLAPGQYLVIGGRIDRANTLGRCAFVCEDEAAPVQRLLVIRTSRVLPEANGCEERTSFSPPLAVQATTSAVRANSH